MSQKRALAQEIRLGSQTVSPRKRVGSGDETRNMYKVGQCTETRITIYPCFYSNRWVNYRPEVVNSVSYTTGCCKMMLSI